MSPEEFVIKLADDFYFRKSGRSFLFQFDGGEVIVIIPRTKAVFRYEMRFEELGKPMCKRTGFEIVFKPGSNLDEIIAYLEFLKRMGKIYMQDIPF